RQQRIRWFHESVDALLCERFLSDPAVAACLEALAAQVLNCDLTPTAGARTAIGRSVPRPCGSGPCASYVRGRRLSAVARSLRLVQNLALPRRSRKSPSLTVPILMFGHSCLTFLVGLHAYISTLITGRPALPAWAVSEDSMFLWLGFGVSS